MEQSTIDEGKTMAIISYVTLIGTLIAFIMNNSKNNEFAKFHIGQAVRAWVTGFVIGIAARILISITGIGLLSFLGYAGLILAVIGLINAINGKVEKIPFVGSIGESK